MEPGWLDELREDVVSRQLDLGEVLQRVVDAATKWLDADRGTLYLVDHARRELVSRVAHLPELREIRLGLGEGIAGWVAQHGRPLRQPNSHDDPRFQPEVDARTGYTTTSQLVVPVCSEDGRVVAVAQLLNHASGAFSADDQARLISLAGNIAELLALSSLGPQLVANPRHPLQVRFNHIVGVSAAMQTVYQRVDRAARTDATVLVRGESGSGKELVARAVHDNSARSREPFVVVDCGALPHHLIENELFGHERGSYTGADRAREGRVAAAGGGTLFLDEVAEVPLAVQPKLLRLLQERTYFPVGATRSRTADVRFVCATHRDLEAMVRAGTFRQDLYYRMNVVEIGVPALRERGAEDLDRLVAHFLFRFSASHGRPGVHLTSEARARLLAHAWPGNVRELQNCLESAVVMADGLAIEPEALPLARRGSSSGLDFGDGLRPLHEVELAYIRHVLARCEGNRTRAAQVLGIGRNTLIRKLKSEES